MDANRARPAATRSLTSRSYEGEHDLRQMQGLLMEARSHTDDWHYGHIGDLSWGFFVLSCHLNPREHIRLWHDGAGRLVGYAMLGEDPSFDCQVLPEHEWSGIENEALDWAEARLAGLRRQDAQRWGAPLVSNARQDDAQRRAFLESKGFRRGAHVEVNMLRSLDQPIPQGPIPDGCHVRAVNGAMDVADRAAVQREVWHPWYVGKVGDGDYARLMRMPGYERDLDLVAVAPGGAIAAYVNGWIDPLNRIGDFGPVGARPAYRRRGLTRAVLIEGLRRMRARGMDRACVSTGESNALAIRLYESIGFAAVNTTIEYAKAG
jgi:ribosomal protein S18 acetylase RimI-like enzyme